MTVLNVIELTKTAPFMKWIVAGCLIGVILFFIIGISCAGKGVIHDKIAGWCFVATVVSLFAAIVCGAISDNVVVPTGEYQYEITIDDETSFSEVIEKYNIIEQRGDIFVVEEKE